MVIQVPSVIQGLIGRVHRGTAEHQGAERLETSYHKVFRRQPSDSIGGLIHQQVWVTPRSIALQLVPVRMMSLPE